MSIKFSTSSFTVEFTGDNSPTLRLPENGESMHHSGGAASETLYIYKTPMDWAYSQMSHATTCVVGLGLGYIEISWAFGRLQSNKGSVLPRLISYEKDESLRQSFIRWMITETDEDIYCRIAQGLGVENSQIKNICQYLDENFKSNPICDDLLQDHKPREFNIVCYDAFSSKTNSELWSSEFLNKFIAEKCAEDCLFTTYACTGNLKSVLRESGFLFIKRPGFQGKRDASLALRGCFRQAYEMSSSQIF